MQSKDYTYKLLEDGQSILTTLHWAEEEKNKHRPIAIAFHGGGFTIGSKDMIPRAQITSLTEAGFVVVAPDYQLCPGISIYDGPLQDAKDIYAWCKTELPAVLANDTKVKADPTRIVTIGYSAGALMALYLGGDSDPPKAILDFYGVKYLTDNFWFSPLPMLAQLPPFEEAFLNKVYEEGVISTTATSLEQSAKSQTSSKSKGMPRPDLSIPRNAWLFDSLKNGTHLQAVVKDGDYERIDPVRFFSPKFPPTFFIHGTKDDLIEPRFSIAASEALHKLGVEIRIQLVEGESHGFDSGMDSSDAQFKYIQEGLDFLTSHVS
ncbi:Alpha/Beta hydrolase protein [Leptodontidium sp. 2 PMI_412]|nr:Alpha/Beta hydrolase protein [Leptodontidium sp. 2 PMI_412]